MAQVFHGHLVLCLRVLSGDKFPGYIRTAGLVLCLNVLLFQNPELDLVARSRRWLCPSVMYFYTGLLPPGFPFGTGVMRKIFIIKVAEEKLGWSILSK